MKEENKMAAKISLSNGKIIPKEIIDMEEIKTAKEFVIKMFDNRIMVEVENLFKNEMSKYDTKKILRDTFFNEHNIELYNCSKTVFFANYNLDEQKRVIFNTLINDRNRLKVLIDDLYSNKSKLFKNTLMEAI